MIAEEKVIVQGKELETEFFLGGDYKYILIMLGLNGATANYACAWCKIHKNDRWQMDHHFNDFNFPCWECASARVTTVAVKKQET